ncbi:MAG TPA: Gfo/Idh/MocA family oxidoreductase [Tepidisphaeraceae bacterium]
MISTGADSHAALAIAAMRAGLHVFIEKPLCTSVAEVRALRQAQRETKAVVGVGHAHLPAHPLMMVAQRYIAEGKLGTVVCYEENVSHSGGLVLKPGDWRGLPSKNPGGMLFQCGVHSFHFLSHLFGPVEAVSAMMRYDANPRTQTADAANVLCRHQNGMIGTINAYHTTAFFYEFRIFGTDGNLYFDTHLNKAWYQRRLAKMPEPRVTVEVPTSPGETYAGLVNWYNAIHGRGEPSPSLDDGVRAVLPVFAAERAAMEKREVSIAELAGEIQ